MARILVTGGAGFIGSHLVDNLSLNNDVVVLDNLSTGLLENLSGCIDRICFVKGDIREKELVQGLCCDKDVVIHLAASSSITDSEKDCMEINIGGTANLVVASLGVKLFVFISSAAVYDGDTRESAQLNPISYYGISKAAGEKCCLMTKQEFKMPVVILRYFNVYGERQRNGIIPALLWASHYQEPFVVYGDGKQTRDFVYVDDVVDATIKSLNHPNRIFNIGTGESTSVNELVRKVELIGGNTIPVCLKNPRDREIRNSRANIRKAKRAFGFNPVSLDRGLSDLMKVN